MSEFFSNMSEPWRYFCLFLAIGVLDAVIQFSDYLQWRKERRESKDAND